MVNLGTCEYGMRYSELPARERQGNMSGQNRIEHVPAGSGPVYWGPGDQIRFLLTGEQTGGAFFLGEALVPPGRRSAAPYPRTRGRDVLPSRGAVTVRVGDQTLHASPGDCVHLPWRCAFVPQHSQRKCEDAGHATPAGIEKFFTEAFYPAVHGNDPPLVTPELMRRMMAAAARAGTTILPPA
jgi:hypothetical protein